MDKPKKKTVSSDYYIRILLAIAPVSRTVCGYFLMNNLIYDGMQDMNTESRNKYVKNLTIAGKFYVGKSFHLDKTLALIM